MPDPLPESQASLDAFLAQHEKDKAADSIRALHEYLAAFPGNDKAIAHEYFSLDGDKTSVSSTAKSIQVDEHFGPYRIIEAIGQGGQGIVYLAEDTKLHRKVALKVLTNLGPGSEDTVTRFRREAEVASKLDHPGICAVYEAGVQDQIPYIAMRYVEGETVARRIAAASQVSEANDSVFSIDLHETTLPSSSSKDDSSVSTTTVSPSRQQVTRILYFFEQAAHALHEAHEHGVIHRDIKPSNLMINKRGEPVVLDFGLARDLESDLPTLTRTGDFFGTPAYMSPEQLMAQRIPLDRRADVYSLGASLYESLTLRKPFDAPTRTALYQAIMGDDPSDARRYNRAIPRDLKVVLDTALEKNRNRRYATALALAEDLRRVRTYEPIVAKPVGPVGRTVRWVKRRPYRAASLLLLFVIVSAVTWYMAKSPERQRMREKARQQELLDERQRTEDLLQEGFLLLHDEMPKQAQKLFEKVLVDAPLAVEAVAGRAQALANLGFPEQAVVSIDEFGVQEALTAGLVHFRAWIAKRHSLGPQHGDETLPGLKTPEDHYLVSRTLGTRGEILSRVVFCTELRRRSSRPEFHRRIGSLRPA